MMTTKDKEFPQRDIRRTFGLCERTCPRYRKKKKLISMHDKREALDVCSPCGIRIPDQYVLSKCNNLVQTSRISSAKGFDSDERRVNLRLAKSEHFKSSSLENETLDNLMLDISHSETYLHKAARKSEKSNQTDLTLPKLFNSQNETLKSSNNSLLLGPPGNNNVYEPLPRIKKVYDKTSFIAKTEKSYYDTFTFEFPTKNKQSKHRRRVSSTKLVHNLQGKFEKGAEKDEKPQLQNKTKKENNEKLDRTPKLKDKSILKVNSKKEEKAIQGDKIKYGSRTKIEDKAKLINLDYKPKLDKQGYTAEIGGTKQEDKNKHENIIKIEDKTNIGVKPKLDSKLPLEIKTKLEDKYKIVNNNKKSGDKNEDIVKLINKSNKIKLGHIAQIGDETKQEDKTKLEDEYNTEIENLGDKTKLKNIDKEKYHTDYIIIGNKIFKYSKPKYKSLQGFLPQHETETRKTTISYTPPIPKNENRASQKKIEKKINTVNAENKGVVRFALSNPKFIDMGWTKLPTQKVVRRLNVYRMRPSRPEYDWFTKNKGKKQMRYDSGETLAFFDDDGCGRWFYRNGNLALDYYNAEESNANKRYVVYSSDENDETGRSQPRTILATFDHLGNGIIFDHSGKVRLKYDQNEGVVLDRSIGPESRWKWHDLNDPPVLQNVIIDTQMPFKDPRITRLREPGDPTAKTTESCEGMLAIEFNNLIRDKSKKMSQSFKPYQIKTKAFKINQNFSLRILDQAKIYLIYRDGTNFIKLNIGMMLDPTEILDTVSCDLGDICNTLERFPARTESIARMQRIVQHAKDVKRARVVHERRLRPLDPTTGLVPAERKAGAGLSLTRQPLAPVTNMVPCEPVEANDCCFMSSVISKPCSFKLCCDG